MSRTYRKYHKNGKVIRDGQWQYPSRYCKHHGGCDWCRSNRTYKYVRQDPTTSVKINEELVNE